MDNQLNEHNIDLDDPETEYYCSPLEIDKSSGLNRLQKLILYNDKINQYDNIKTLIKTQPELINEPNTQGWTALMIACTNSRKYKTLDIIKLLLNFHDIDVNHQQIRGWTALMLSARNSNIYSNIDTVRLLLSNPNIDVNMQNNEGWSSLMFASRDSHDGSNIETVRLLLSSPNINVNQGHHSNWTSLMFSLGNCGYSDYDGNGSDIETVELLLKYHDIDPNIQNDDGNTALMLFLKYRARNHLNCAKIIKYLLEQEHTTKFNLDLMNRKHKSALDYAIRTQKLDIIELLCSHGASLSNSMYTIERLQGRGLHDMVKIIQSYDIPTKGVMFDNTQKD